MNHVTMLDLLELLTLTGRTTVRTDEYDLQTALAAALTDAGFAPRREERLSDGQSRVDIWLEVPGVAIEVKVAGGAAAVQRQLERYAACPEVQTVVLVTTRANHHTIARDLGGKPMVLVSLVEAGL